MTTLDALHAEVPQGDAQSERETECGSPRCLPFSVHAGAGRVTDQVVDVGDGSPYHISWLRLSPREFTRFAACIQMSEADGHWIWTGPVDHRGYGRAYVNGKRMSVQRIAYGIVFGMPWRDLRVVPFCGEQRCVRYNHLAAGGGQPLPPKAPGRINAYAEKEKREQAADAELRGGFARRGGY